MTSSFALPGPAGDARVRGECLAAASAFGGYLELEGRVQGGQLAILPARSSRTPRCHCYSAGIYVYMLRFAALDRSVLLLPIPEFVEHLTNGCFWLPALPMDCVCV
jgi:hypothetical protein